LLVQMDGVGKDSKGVLILGATNIPWQLDAAIRRRFQRRAHISLPDMPARVRMFEIAVGDTPCQLSPADYKKLAEQSEGYSGSDIAIAVQDALMQPVRKIQTATHYKKVRAVVSSPPRDPVLIDGAGRCRRRRKANALLAGRCGRYGDDVGRCRLRKAARAPAAAQGLCQGGQELAAHSQRRGSHAECRMDGRVW